MERKEERKEKENKIIINWILCRDINIETRRPKDILIIN